jgi:hypothetical protein
LDPCVAAQPAIARSNRKQSNKRDGTKILIKKISNVTFKWLEIVMASQFSVWAGPPDMPLGPKNRQQN